MNSVSAQWVHRYRRLKGGEHTLELVVCLDTTAKSTLCDIRIGRAIHATYPTVEIRPKQHSSEEVPHMSGVDTYEDMILSPARQMAAMAMNWAACPLDAATAATPPSSAAIRLSNTLCQLNQSSHSTNEMV